MNHLQLFLCRIVIQPASVLNADLENLSNIAHVPLPADSALDANTETFLVFVGKMLKKNGLLVTRLRVRVNERCLSCQVPSRTSIGRHSYSWA
jgi:hypothetical protein